jgi:hypothetical protein
MATFKDSKGTKWSLKITIGGLEEVRDRLDIDLGVPGAFENHIGNLIDTVNVVYVLCEKQACQRGIDDEAFGRRMSGDALGRARESLCQAWLSFVPRHQRLQTEKFLMASKKIGAVRESVLTEMVKHLKAKVKQGTLSRTDTDWEELLEVTHDPSSSGNSA